MTPNQTTGRHNSGRVHAACPAPATAARINVSNSQGSTASPPMFRQSSTNDGMA